MYKADTDKARLPTSSMPVLPLPPPLPSLPLEAWDMIISWIPAKKDLYSCTLVCWDFAELVRRYLRPRLWSVGGYKVRIFDDVSYNITELFIDNDSVPSVYLIKKNMLLMMKFYLTEYTVKDLWPIDTRIYPIVGNDEYIVFDSVVSKSLLITRIDGTRIGHIRSGNYPNIIVKIKDDRLFLFNYDCKRKYVDHYVEEYSLTNIILVARNKFDNQSMADYMTSNITIYRDHACTVYRNCIVKYNIDEKSYAKYTVASRLISPNDHYIIDNNNLLIESHYNGIYIYAKNKLLSETTLLMDPRDMVITDLQNKNRIYILSNNTEMIIYEY